MDQWSNVKLYLAPLLEGQAFTEFTTNPLISDYHTARIELIKRFGKSESEVITIVQNTRQGTTPLPQYLDYLLDAMTE